MLYEVITDFLLWGFSIGAAVAVQVAAHSQHVLGATIAGSFFGKAIKEYASKNIPGLEAAINAKETGLLAEWDLASVERKFIEARITSYNVCYTKLLRFAKRHLARQVFHPAVGCKDHILGLHVRQRPFYPGNNCFRRLDVHVRQVETADHDFLAIEFREHVTVQFWLSGLH